MALIICPVRPGDSNEELRYAIRSWEANLHLGEDLELLIVGYCPTWLKPDHFIEGNKVRSMPFAVFDNILLGAQEASADGYEEVIFMNDDFFCLDPVGKIMPVKRNITLAEQIALMPPNMGLWWGESLRLTRDWLDREGFPHPDSYEVHRPLPASPRSMAEALLRWRFAPEADKSDTVPQWRTIYGVLNKVEAHPVSDVKLGTRVSGIGAPWISTSDQSWRRYAAPITKRFQKPSRWEV